MRSITCGSTPHWALCRLPRFALVMIAGSFGLVAVTLRADETTTSGGADYRQKLDAQQLADLIDEELARSWTANRLQPASLADDAAFLRRVTLDLSGKIPSVAEAREFLADDRKDKRARRIEELLSRATFATHLANLWRESIVPGGNSDFQIRALAGKLESWLRLQLADNASYDRLVFQLLTPPANGTGEQAPDPLGSSGPAAYFAVNGRKPENLAASATRMFLGIRLECAQCHDHPFSAWEQEDFWSFAAFFSALDPQSGAGEGQPLGAEAAKIKIPNTDRVVTPRFLDKTRPQWKPGDDPVDTLAAWITARDNPYFARATVNRMWASFFGRGLVDPVDDLDESNPPSHPVILDVVSQQFMAHDFDLRYLAHAITLTDAYQRSSAASAAAGDDNDLRDTGSGDATATDDVESYLRMPVRHLTAEQLFDSFVQATGLPADEGRRQAFLSRFASADEKLTDARTSILQALALMNGPLVAEATNLERSRTLTAVAEAPFLDTAARVETLYLAALTRQPDQEEQQRLVAFVEEGGTTGDKTQALGDVFWALLNSAEFMLNH